MISNISSNCLNEWAECSLWDCGAAELPNGENENDQNWTRGQKKKIEKRSKSKEE